MKTKALDPKTVAMAHSAKALSHPATVEVLKRLAKSGELACIDAVNQRPSSQRASSHAINALLFAGHLKSRPIASKIFFILVRCVLGRFGLA